MKQYNFDNLKDDDEVVKNWEPLKFEIKDNYKYISKNIFLILFLMYYVLLSPSY